jgi:hypothetical protein
VAAVHRHSLTLADMINQSTNCKMLINQQITNLLARNLLLQTSHCPASHSVCSWCVESRCAELSKARARCSLSSVSRWTRVSRSSPIAATNRFFSSPFTYKSNGMTSDGMSHFVQMLFWDTQHALLCRNVLSSYKTHVKQLVK